MNYFGFLPFTPPEEKMDVPPLHDLFIVTGGAQGVDAEAERQALRFGAQLDVVIGPNHPRAKSITPLSEEELNKTIHHFASAQQQLGRRVSSPITAEYLKRNFFIAARADAVYAFGFLEQQYTQMKGGTGWTVAFAQQLRRPIFAYDLHLQKWYKFNYRTHTFHAMGGGKFPLLSDKSAIVGARKAESYPGWKNALEGLFQRTLQLKQPFNGTLF